jgi:hypothetical protein
VERRAWGFGEQFLCDGGFRQHTAERLWIKTARKSSADDSTGHDDDDDRRHSSNREPSTCSLIIRRKKKLERWKWI